MGARRGGTPGRERGRSGGDPETQRPRPRRSRGRVSSLVRTRGRGQYAKAPSTHCPWFLFSPVAVSETFVGTRGDPTVPRPQVHPVYGTRDPSRSVYVSAPRLPPLPRHLVDWVVGDVSDPRRRGRTFLGHLPWSPTQKRSDPPEPGSRGYPERLPGRMPLDEGCSCGHRRSLGINFL